MQTRWLVLGLLLLGVFTTTGCGWRRSAYRCPPQPALLPAVAVPVTAASPCCPPPCP